MNSKKYSVVIVGAGCLGASVFRSLKKKGVEDVLVLDSGRVGGGVSSYSGGVTRVFHQKKKDQIAAQYSQDVFYKLRNEVGLDVKQVGSLCILNKSEATKMNLKDFTVLTSTELKKRFKNFKFKENEIGIYEEKGATISVKEYTEKCFSSFKKENDDIYEEARVDRIERLEETSYAIHTNLGVFYASKVVLTSGKGIKDLLPEICLNEVTETRNISTFQVGIKESSSIPNFFDYSNIFYGTKSFRGESNNFKVGVKSGCKGARRRVEKYFGERFTFPFSIQEESKPIKDLYFKDRGGLSGEVCGKRGAYVLAGWGGGAFKFSPYLGENLVSEICSRGSGYEYSI